MQNFYKIGKIIESQFNKIDHQVEYYDIVNIILDYVKDDTINCDKINCKRVVIFCCVNLIFLI